MKKNLFLTFAIMMSLASGCAQVDTTNLTKNDSSKPVSSKNFKEISAIDVINAVDKTIAYHIQNPRENISLRDWEIAAYYDGLISFSKVTGDPRYWAEVIRCGYANSWLNGRLPYHADHHAVGRAWVETYMGDTSKSDRLKYVKGSLDKVIEDAKNCKDATKQGNRSPIRSWDWCDALYMSPPTLSKLYLATKDKKYLEHMNSEFKWCYDKLFSEPDDLFYRDNSFIGKTSPQGKKIFWGRGNGWVVAGLTFVLNDIPNDSAEKKFYEDMLVRMLKRIAKEQGDDGLWGVNLDDSTHFKGGETSASGFFTYALAWAVNNGYLNRQEYMPKVLKAWEGLLTRVDNNGRVGYVQPVGASPDSFTKDTTQSYGVGAFVLAGAEVARCLGASANITSSELVKRADAIFESTTPLAYAHYEPRRADDIAWENDKVAFRAYGPALKKSIENSGIDVFGKVVSYPVINKWYDDSLLRNKDYHTNRGEGADMFKVADTVGCGGTGIYKNGKLYNSNVYTNYEVMLTSPKNLEIWLTYHYNIDGEKITENKIISLNLGSNLCTSKSTFYKGHIVCTGFGLEHGHYKNKAIKDLTVATGLYSQSKQPKIEFGNKSIIIDDVQEEKQPIRLYCIISGDTEFLEFKTVEKANGHKEVLAIIKTDSEGSTTHKFGYELKGTSKK